MNIFGTIQSLLDKPIPAFWQKLRLCLEISQIISYVFLNVVHATYKHTKQNLLYAHLFNLFIITIKCILNFHETKFVKSTFLFFNINQEVPSTLDLTVAAVAVAAAACSFDSIAGAASSFAALFVQEPFVLGWQIEVVVDVVESIQNKNIIILFFKTRELGIYNIPII